MVDSRQDSLRDLFFFTQDPNHTIIAAEAQHFVSAHDTEREPCRGGSNDQWVKDPDTCEPSCYDPYASSCIYVANSVCVSIFNE